MNVPVFRFLFIIKSPMLNGPKLSGADSTQLAAWRRERAGHFCLCHARMLQAYA